ncbi:MAG: thioesterase family protein [Candidatus Omnitrophota bacterium]|nr:thioesterase family protein [Candidatus Omnitrophota bacterium]
MNYFDYEYRVRYSDTDKMAVSYYANYFLWFEAARTEYFRALGLPYTDCEKEGIYLPVVEAQAKYHSSSTYDDLLVVRTSVSLLRRSSMRFEYRVFPKGDEAKLIATGFTVHVFVNDSMRPISVPPRVRENVKTFVLLA